MANYAKIEHRQRRHAVELHDKLALTGAEVSVNQLPAGAGVPFVHAHKANEEIYGVLAGEGTGRHRRRSHPPDRRRLAARSPRRQASVLRVGPFRHHLRVHSGSGKFSGSLHRRRRHYAAEIPR